MTPAEIIVSRLEGVRPRGQGRWAARCPSHGDRSPSLSIAEGADGRALLYCFSGCGVADILGALGLQAADLFPRDDRPQGTPGTRIPAADILRAAAFEAAVVAVAAGTIERGQPLTTEDVRRVGLAAARLQAAADYGRPRHERR